MAIEVRPNYPYGEDLPTVHTRDGVIGTAWPVSGYPSSIGGDGVGATIDNDTLKITVTLPPGYSPQTYAQTLKAAYIAGEYVKLFAKKQESYGVGNIDEFGELGVLVRATDKAKRLKQLIYENRTNDLESIEDTWIDLMGYGLIGLLVHRGKWRD